MDELITWLRRQLDDDERVALACLRRGHAPDGTVRCWWCGVEPELVEITRVESAEPEYMPGCWPTPGGDHVHATEPPSPGQLEQAGHEALMRIMREVA